MAWPKQVINIEMYDVPRKGDWHKERYRVHGSDGGIWTDSLDDALEYVKKQAIRVMGNPENDVDPIEEIRMKPKGKVLLKSIGKPGYVGWDSKWHLVTSYIESDTSLFDDDRKHIFAMFTWKGEKDSAGVDIADHEGPSQKLVFKDSDTGRSLTAAEAIEIITGNTKIKQQKEKKDGRHNNKKTNRRKVQKVRAVRDRVKGDPKLV
jgi:hypothetical protein